MIKINYLCTMIIQNKNLRIMVANITQETPKAQKLKKVPSRIKVRTESEVRAYSYLPDSIKDQFYRNRRVRFARCHVYYPDLLLPEAKIVIEIDGTSHSSEKGQRRDMKKDKEFSEHGYAMIRIKDEETTNKTTFLYKLYYELLKIPDIKKRKEGQKFVKGVEDFLYSMGDEEYLIDESEFSFSGIVIK